MEISGKLIQVTIPESKTTASGKDFITCLAIIETDGQYPKKVAIELNKAELIESVTKVNLGSNITFSVNLESREFNGKYYNSIRAWSFK